MGGAVICGLANGEDKPGKILLVEPDEKRRSALEEKYSLEAAGGIDDVIKSCDAIVIAVKPDKITAVLSEVKNFMRADALLFSVAAGVTIRTMETLIGREVPIARTMPNIAALAGEAAIAVCFSRKADDVHRALGLRIAGSIGRAVEVEEKCIDGVTGLSGSGPAYVFLMIEALADGGVLMGIPREEALALAVQTVRGAAVLVQETGLHPAVLREMVTSPGGTTAEGLARLEAGGFRHACIDAVRAAAQKAGELGRTAQHPR